MNFITPTSIAVIGASATEGKVGHDVLQNLLTQGYEGNVFPINPKHESILDTKTYASIRDVQDTIDLAIIVVPAPVVPNVLMECAEKSITDIIIISAGFGEIGTEEGDHLEQDVKDIATKHQLNIIGPNCLGVIRPDTNMNASFASDIPPKGSVAFISQSGAMAVGMMDSAKEIGLGFSLVTSIGNKAILDECDFLHMAENDPHTSVIGLYLESIQDGPRLLKTASQCTKPIVLLKAGVSEHGSSAAASHTGALAGNDAAIDALCAQTGIHRARTTEELLDALEVLSKEPCLPSSAIAIITNAGGPGILATDAAEYAKLTMPPLDPKHEASLKEALPDTASTKNPIDLIGDAGVDRYQAALDTVGRDPGIDGVCLVLTPQVMTPCEDIVHVIIEWKKRHPLMPIVTSFIGHDRVAEQRRTLQNAGIPSFETPERAIKALASLRRKKHKVPYTPHAIDTARTTQAQKLLGEYKGLIPADITQQLFELYNIPIPPQQVATNEQEAVDIANKIGYPVIAKIASPHILHKTDIGGVKADLQTEEDVRCAWNDIQENTKKHHPEEHGQGILIQQFLPAGTEFIVGSVRDDVFGHLIMSGLGGIYTELLQDTAFRITPVATQEVYLMLSELLAWNILQGMRGKDALDTDRLVELICAVSQLVTECPQIKDIDLNPVFVYKDHIVVTDVKIVVE